MFFCRTIEEYFLPLVDTIPKFLENLTDEELKKETKVTLAFYKENMA